ncbi:hypothetical protein AAF712_016671, partial [Marasmius tenuissimus]
TFVFALFIKSCSAFNFTIQNQVSVGQFVLQWNASSSDFDTTAKSFIIVLVKPPEGFYCPVTDVANGLGSNFDSVVKDFHILQAPNSPGDSSGQSVLNSQNTG